MDTQNKSGYMLLFVGTDWHKGLSPEQMQKVAEEMMTWFKRLKDDGKAVAGHPLGFEGKVVSGKNRTVTDGPFAEAKEAIGGYFMLDVATMDGVPIDAPPPVGMKWRPEFIRGIAHHAGRFIILPDLARIFTDCVDQIHRNGAALLPS